MRERFIRDGELTIASETFGNPTDPTILLNMGGGASMLWWPQEFCEILANRGHYVIRYDQRETGLSTPYIPGGPSHTYDDLVDDAWRVLDGYALSAAHLVGMSLGGLVAQLAALRHPSRVRSLTAISSSPFGIDKPHLPRMSDAYSAHLAAADQVDWSDRAQAIAFMVEEARLVASTAHPFEESRVSAFVAQDYDRAGGYPSSSNFTWQGGDEWRGRLKELRPPLLVIHGATDPVFPLEHGVVLAKTVPGAKFVRLAGGGHEIHPADWDSIIAAITNHVSAMSET